jgi:hypothetical protein
VKTGNQVNDQRTDSRVRADGNVFSKLKKKSCTRRNQRVYFDDYLGQKGIFYLARSCLRSLSFCHGQSYLVIT